MTNNIPRWNLDSIFSSIDSPEYQKALADFTAGMENLENLLESARTFITQATENFDFPVWLKGFLEADDKVSSLCGSLNAYAYIIYSVDTTNTAYLNNITKIDNLTLRYRQIDLGFKSVLLANSGRLDDFYKRFPEFESYRYLLNETLEETKHQMSPAEEKLAGELQQTGGDAWDRLHEQLISNLKDEESGKTFNELRNDAYSADANVRKSSYLKEIALLKQNEIAFAACLGNLKGETLALNRRRKWQKPIDRALAAARLSQKTLDALIGAIEDSLPLWREYFNLKADFLHKHNLTVSQDKKGLAFYDLFAPMATDSRVELGNDGNNKLRNDSDTLSLSGLTRQSLLSKTWTFDEARDYIIQRYSSFSSEMGDFAKKAFAEKWIDAEVRAGKVGGAYDEDFALGHQSRIMTNFTGAFSDIITLAHELGHAYHFSCMKGKPAAFFSYPMTLAETASTFAETIVKQDMISKCSDAEKIQILDLDLQDVSQVLVDILCRFYFEKSVFDEREKGELNASDFCRLMKEAQEKSYGSGLNGERHEYMWAVKSHYYSTGLDFYNFPYAFGQLFAAGLYARYQKEGAAFAKTYAELLSNTGNMSCEDLCKKAGFDITQKDFWKSGIEMYAKEVSELKSICG
ncbi:MAG: M3 family oligoendopeptidase [Treponema sp.]|uniref:M3 family oligoendopeptidase n=1 Tax=Treponema sp. TaxID=166 RepID=UPI0025EC72B1|nr:M3 family oligoendopeptidase [Treponema sp.]MBQ9282940.1 M3 family oligoendopeptidase [Treponema sp.]